jgi:hypothetical protein
MNWSTINWGSVADWVSGFGSVSAAVVALYLSQSAQRIKLRGYCGIRAIVGRELPHVGVFSIGITNVGNRATVVNSISIRTGLFKKNHAIIVATKNEYSVGVPHPLADGQEWSYLIPLGEKQAWLQDLCKDLIVTSWDVRTLRFQVHTTNGGHLTLRPEESLKKALLSIIAAKATYRA